MRGGIVRYRGVIARSAVTTFTAVAAITVAGAAWALLFTFGGRCLVAICGSGCVGIGAVGQGLRVGKTWLAGCGVGVARATATTAATFTAATFRAFGAVAVAGGALTGGCCAVHQVEHGAVLQCYIGAGNGLCIRFAAFTLLAGSALGAATFAVAVTAFAFGAVGAWGAGFAITAIAAVAVTVAWRTGFTFGAGRAVAYGAVCTVITVIAWRTGFSVTGGVATAVAALTTTLTALTTTVVAVAVAAATAGAVAALGALAITTTLAALATCAALGFVVLLGHCCGGRRHGRGRGRHTKQAAQPGEEAGGGHCSGHGHGHRRGGGWSGRGWRRGFCARCRRRGRCIGQHTLDHRGLAVGGLLRAAGHGGGVFHLFGHFVAGLDMVEARVVVLQAFELVVRRFQRLVGHHQHVDALLQLDLGDFGAFFVQQERRHFDWHLAQHGSGVVLHGLFLDDPQDLQRRAFRVADVAGATAARAGNGRAFAQCGLQALAAHFHQAELADGAELHAGAVLAQRVAQAVFHFAAVLRLFHVDEVDDDQAAQVAQAHLAGHFVGGFQVGAGGGFFDVAALDGAGRVDVDGHQRFGVVDHDGAARRQAHGAGIGRLDLVLDLEAAEQRRVVAVTLHAGGMFGHHMRHELLGLLVNVVGVDQDVADVVVEVITDRADDKAGFLVNQEGALAALGGAIDGGPQLEQVVQVPLQLGCAAADAGGAGDDAGPLGVFQLVHGFFQLGPVVAFDAARDAAATRVVGHQHDVAAGQRDEGGQGRALVAAFFLFDLDNQFLAFLDHFIDAGLAGGHTFGEVLARDFLEGQKTVAVFAVVHKTGFQRGLDAGDDGLVDVALALFAPFDFDFVVEEFLSIDDGQAAFFGLRGIDQHPLHDAFLRNSKRQTCPCRALMPEQTL